MVRAEKTGASANLRVLYLINGLGGGGAERSLLELLPHYDAAGIELVVGCFRRREEGVEEEVSRLAVDLHYFSGGSVMNRARQVRSFLRTKRFDLVHTTIFESDLTGRVAAAGLPVPVLTSLVNTSYAKVRLSDPNVSRCGLWTARMLDGWTARNLTTHFHAITQAVKDASVHALGIDPDRITVIERGRDLVRLGSPSSESRRRARRVLGLDDDEEVIVSVGRQEFQKGQKYLLEAFSRIVRNRPRARLLLVGRRGHASTDLEALHEELQLEERALFLGHRENVPELLASADVFVFPSLFEGQGGALIEAMAMGLPVIATDIPSTREVVEEERNALLVPVESSQSLAEALERLLDDPALMSAFGQRSSKIFHARFTLERSALRMVELYRSVIGQGAFRSQSDRAFS